MFKNRNKEIDELKKGIKRSLEETKWVHEGKRLPKEQREEFLKKKNKEQQVNK